MNNKVGSKWVLKDLNNLKIGGVNLCHVIEESIFIVNKCK